MNINRFKYLFIIVFLFLCLMIFSFFHLKKNKNNPPAGLWSPSYSNDNLSFYNPEKDLSIKFTILADESIATNVKPKIIPNIHIPKSAFYSFIIDSDKTNHLVSSIANEELAVQFKNDFKTILSLEIEIENSRSVDIDTVSKIIDVNKGELVINYTGSLLYNECRFFIKILADHVEHFYTNSFSSINDVITNIDYYNKMIESDNQLLNLPASFPDIYWLASDVEVDEDSFIYIKDNDISYLNPDFFKLIFNSINTSDSSIVIFLEKVFKKFNETDQFYLPLSALITSNIYRKTRDAGFVENNFLNLLKMNRKWDKMIMSEISEQESGNYHAKFKNNTKIFGVPSYFYISLHIKDCQELLFLAEETGQNQYLNEFRNRILKYTKFINENQSLLWDTEQLTNLDKIDSMMPYYDFYLDTISKQQFEKSVFDKLVQINKHTTIETYYKVISLLLTYYSLG